MEQTLIKDEKYSGRYVAIGDFHDATVVADGQSPQEAYDNAVKNGHKDPVIIFVPETGVVQIY